jgi:ribosomal protein S9
MKKIFLVSYNGYNVGTFTNRKLAWSAVLEVLQTSEVQLKEKERTLTCEYVTGGDWRRMHKCKTALAKRITSLATFSSILLKSTDLIIRDKQNFQDKVTVQFRYLNDVDLPARVPEY